ncbi:MAG TPA: helix-turn-helix transcriptional regulator [Clostridiaceae bacterium]|nr:helix-turn-helix transcriptional regulator [Clostridiaceae bacterium]
MKKNHKLKEYRKKHKMTQKELADLVGVTSDYISQIERGRIPGMFTAIKLAKIFDTTLEDLFLNNQNDEGQNNTNQNNENQK